MSEIEKLYYNVKVFPKLYRNIMNKDLKGMSFDEMCKENFTPKKQIELLKMFVDLGEWKSFEEGIAGTINIMFQQEAIRPEELAKIRKILDTTERIET